MTRDPSARETKTETARGRKPYVPPMIETLGNVLTLTMRGKGNPSHSDLGNGASK